MTTCRPSGSLCEVVQKPLASVVNQIEDDVEAAHIVGVGYIHVVRIRGKLEEPNDSFGIEVGGGLLTEVTFIRGIHGNEPIVALKVRRSQFSRALLGDVEAPFLGDGNGARVGRLSCMPSTCPARVHLEVQGQVLLSELSHKDTFCKRGAADVAEADKEYGGFIHGDSRL